MAVLLDSSILQEVVQGLVVGIPNLVYTLVLLVFGYVIGKMVGIIVERIVVRSKVDSHLKEKGQLSFTLSSVLGTVSKWAIYMVFLQQAALQFGILAISSVINAIIAFIPGIIGAVLVMIASYAIAIYVKESIIGSKEFYASLIGKIVFFFIIYLGIATALPIMKIGTELINNILLIIMASIGAGVAIAMGLGLKESIAEVAKIYVKRVAKEKPAGQ